MGNITKTNMADPASVWLQLILLFMLFPHKNILCVAFVFCSAFFIPTFAFPETYYANLHLTKLEKQHVKNRYTQSGQPNLETVGLGDIYVFKGSFSKIGSVREVEGKVHWVRICPFANYCITASF